MPRNKFTDKRRAAIPEGMVEFLKTGKVAKGDLGTFLDKDDPEKLAAAWSAIGADLTAECIKRSPGTRPYFWWIAEGGLRLRVGGIGTERREVFRGWKQKYDFGVPRHVSNWVNPRDVRLGIFARAFDANDPPTFESQPTCLRRLGLLQPGEEKKLSGADFAPEAIA